MLRQTAFAVAFCGLLCSADVNPAFGSESGAIVPGRLETNTWEEARAHSRAARATREHARLVAALVEIQADGEYQWPSRVADLESVSGWLGIRLKNPYTGARTEPRDGWAASPGEITYVPIMVGGINVGGEVMCFGRVRMLSAMTMGRDPRLDW